MSTDRDNPRAKTPMRPEEILGLLPQLNFFLPEHNPGLRLFALELLFWTVVAAVTVALMRFRPTALERAEQKLRLISQHQRFWLVAIGASVVVLRVALLPWIPVPVPVVHDEFSYLLAADTFAHGRVTNPPSPMWVHFETFHVNMLPTYQSMYPPAYGMALAIGQKLSGVPWLGVVLSTALMCSAIYWMLLGWLSAPWAWLGGAFAVVRYGIFSYWMNSYFGGSVTALGGALILGALPRLRREPRLLTGLIFALGLLILATSRPLEGFCFSIALVLSGLVYWVKKGAGTWRETAGRLAPGFALLIAGFGWMLYYNWRGTGNALLMPYVLNYKLYHVSQPFLHPVLKKPFLLGTLNPIPEYHHQVMRTFYVYHEMPDVLRVKLGELGDFFRLKANILYVFFLWPLLLLVAPGIWAMFRDKEFRVVPIAVGLLSADLFAQIWPPEAHYAAPATGAIILMVLYSLRHVRGSHPAYGVWASRAVVLVFSVWLLSPIAERLRDPYGIFPNFAGEDAVIGKKLAERVPLQIRRARIEADLERRPGKHLVIVHHPYRDVPSVDWIYNEADLDHAKVIWARDMGYLKNKELLDLYPDRQAWYVDRGDMAARIWPYDQAITPWRLALDHRASDSIDALQQPQEVRHKPPYNGPKEPTTRLMTVSNSGTSSR